MMTMSLTLDPLHEHVILYNSCLEPPPFSAVSLIFAASITSPLKIHAPFHLDILVSIRKFFYSSTRNGHRALCLDLKVH